MDAPRRICIRSPMNARVPSSVFNTAQALEHVSAAWDKDIVHRLEEYIRIPASRRCLTRIGRRPVCWTPWCAIPPSGSRPRKFPACSWRSSGSRVVLRSSFLKYPPVVVRQARYLRPAKPCSCMAIWISSRSSQVGATTWVPGPPNTRTASCTAVAARTTATLPMRRLPHCRRSKTRSCVTREWSA